MTVFDHPSFDEHEHVVFHTDAESGLKAIIAIHNTLRGPSVGGCRMWPYTTEADGLADALRLSRGMTYKSTLAGLPFGGGKSVVFGDPATDKSEQLWRAMGRFVESLGGRYVIAEDVGTSPADMEIVRSETRHVSGIAEGGSGDPSPATACCTSTPAILPTRTARSTPSGPAPAATSRWPRGTRATSSSPGPIPGSAPTTRRPSSTATTTTSCSIAAF